MSEAVKKSIVERAKVKCAKVIADGENGDKIVFEVGDEKRRVESRKSLLGKHSSVFHSMFYGELKEKDVIEITDCKGDVFEYLLKHLNGANLEIASFQVAHSLYIAEKYMLNELKGALISYTIDNVNYENCVDIYQASILLDNKDLQSASISWLCSKAEDVLKLDSLLDLPEDILLPFISNEALHNIEELKLFQFVKTWIKFNRKSRSKLLDTIQLNRMSFEEIDNFVKPTKLFSFEKLYQALFDIDKKKESSRYSPPKKISENSNLVCEFDSLAINRFLPETEFSFNSDGFYSFNKNNELLFKLADIYGLRLISFSICYPKDKPFNISYYASISQDGVQWVLLNKLDCKERTNYMYHRSCHYTYTLKGELVKYIKFAFFPKERDVTYTFRDLNCLIYK